MTSNLTLYDCLQQVSLEKYHGNFLQRGIVDVSGLPSLTMQDYPSLGISSMTERQNLFFLIQTIKAMQPQSSERTNKDGSLQFEGSAVKGKGIKRYYLYKLELSFPHLFYSPLPPISPPIPSPPIPLLSHPYRGEFQTSALTYRELILNGLLSGIMCSKELWKKNCFFGAECGHKMDWLVTLISLCSPKNLHTNPVESLGHSDGVRVSGIS